MSTMGNDLTEIANLLSNFEIDDSNLKGQVVDEDVVAFYTKRFEIFKQDECPLAINVYLNRAQNDENINELTKVAIMQSALQHMC